MNRFVLFAWWFVAVGAALSTFASDARAQYKPGVEPPRDDPSGFEAGRKVFPERVYRLGDDPQGKLEVLNSQVDTREKSVVVYTRQTDDSTFKWIATLEAERDALKDCPVHVVFLFADRKPLADKAARIKGVSLYLSNRKGPQDWGVFDIDPKVETMAFLVQRGTIKTKLEVREGQATDARSDELAKAILDYVKAPSWAPAGIKDRLAGHPGGARSMVFSPDGKRLYTHGTQQDSGEDARISKWDLATGTEEANVSSHVAGAYGLDLTRDGGLLLSAGPQYQVKLWNPDTLKLIDTLQLAFPPRCVRINPDQQTFAVGGGLFDDRIQIFDLKTRRAIRTLKAGANCVRSLDYSPDGKRLVSGDERGKVKVWNVAEGKELKAWSGHARSIECVAFSPDGKRVAAGGNSLGNGLARAQIWDVETGQEVRELESTGLAWVTSVVFLPSGKTLAVAGHGQSVHLIDLETGKIVGERNCQASIVLSLALGRDGTTLAAGSWHATIWLWDVTEKK